MFNSKNVRRVLIGTAAGLTLAAGLAWGVGFSAESAFAQVTNQAGQGTMMEARGGMNMGGRGMGHMERGASFGGTLLANALGLTPVELQEAQKNAQSILIDQAAAAGVITAEQATQLKEGQRPTGDISGLRTYMADVNHDAALAQALGITSEALTAAKDTQVQKGVEAGLITQEQGNQMLVNEKIRNATKAATEQAIQEAVAEGLLTQEQADNMINGQGRKGGFDGGFGGRGGPGQFRQGGRSPFGSFNSAPEGVPAPSNTSASSL